MTRGRKNRRPRLVPTVCAFALVASVSARAEVNLELVPSVQSSRTGEIVLVEMRAKATGLEQLVAGIDAIITWDAEHLGFEGFIDPCMTPPCAPGTYDWLQANFPNDSQLDGLNINLTDGDALYQALAQLGRDNAALVTPQGLHVMTMVFRSAAPGQAAVGFEPTFGSVTRTRVLSGDFTGEEVTGTLGPPAVVNIATCAAPDVSVIGTRYLIVEPVVASQSVALLVTGDENDGAISCFSAYVQTNGSLGPNPVFQLGSEWEQVSVHGAAIRPDTAYAVQADCGSVESPSLSDPVLARTWRWGDANGDDQVTISDVTRVVNAANGNFSGGTVLENVDLAPCAPDGVVNTADITAALDALGQIPFPCDPPCQPLTWDILDAFTQCMTGPTAPVGTGCSDFDLDGNDHCDLADFARVQREFTSP